MNRQPATKWVLLTTILLAGCSDVAQLLTSGPTVDLRPARVSLTATVAASAPGLRVDPASLSVLSSYVRDDGELVPLGTFSQSLGVEASMAVPIPVEIAPCLADARREGGAGIAGCPVVLTLVLSVNGVNVDRQVVGPLRLTPGVARTVNEPVALFQIAEIVLTPAGSLTLLQGASSSLAAEVRDSRGQVVTGRTIEFSTDNPAVATVNAAGRVAAVGSGETRIVATLGTLSSSVSVRVARAPVALTITAPVGSAGAGTVRSQPIGIDCRIAGTTVTGSCAFAFAADVDVVLTTVPDAGHALGLWTGACGTVLANVCTLSMTQPRVTSVQLLAPQRLQITAPESDGSGRVTGGFGLDCRIDGIALSGVCAVDVPQGAVVTLTAVPDAEQATRVAQLFGGWGGDCNAAIGSVCTFTMAGSPRAAVVRFRGGKALSVTFAGNGNASISADAGIACTRTQAVTSGACTKTVQHGTSVVLTLAADPLTEFLGWSGACTGTISNCTVTMSEARQVTATIVRRTLPLTVTLAGSGNGVVAVNGEDICARTMAQAGAVTCVRNYEVGASVTVTATPGLRTGLNGVSGDCSGIGACQITMSAPRAITALFIADPPVTLVVEGMHSGTGTIRSAEAQPIINCTVRDGIASGSGCSANVPVGTQLTLTAVGSAGNALRSWSGACVNRVTHECVVTVSTGMTVIAGFTPAIDVEMQLSGAGQGTVTFQPEGAPAQAPCALSAAPVSCRFALPTGLSGAFRGLPTAASTFVGFTGPCAESNGSAPVPVCTYRGVGFLRTFNGIFGRRP